MLDNPCLGNLLNLILEEKIVLLSRVKKTNKKIVFGDPYY